MGEANRVLEFGKGARVEHRIPIQAQNPQSGQQIQVDLKNATSKTCQNKVSDTTETGIHERVCGCEFFIPMVKLYTISALVSPVGKELTVQQSFLVCKDCGAVVV
jgi:hypothetical protein